VRREDTATELRFFKFRHNANAEALCAILKKSLFMGYYTRVFCKSAEVPSVNMIFSYLNKLGNNSFVPEDYFEDMNSTDWRSFSLKYKTGRLPLLIELNKIADEDSLAKEEIDEFLEEIGSPGFSFNKRKVVSHLKATKYVIASQLATSDIDNDGYNANGEFLKYFADNFEGLIQADGEGFYNDSKLIIPE
jgi:hypothetical protein